MSTRATARTAAGKAAQLAHQASEHQADGELHEPAVANEHQADESTAGECAPCHATARRIAVWRTVGMTAAVVLVLLAGAGIARAMHRAALEADEADE